MKAFYSLLNAGREYLFPGGCCFCGSMLTGAAEIADGLCPLCEKSFRFEKEEERCLFCGKPLVSEKSVCLDCREIYPELRRDFERLISLFPYTGKYRDLLWAFKYRGSLGAAGFLADKLLEALSLFNAENPVLVPVPPRPGKIRRTGWDQIELLGRALRRRGNAPLSPCLVREARESQKKLSREERLINLKNKIRAQKQAPEISVLFDDVITTGATMAACASALKAAGAEKIYGVCLFYD